MRQARCREMPRALRTRCGDRVASSAASPMPLACLRVDLELHLLSISGYYPVFIRIISRYAAKGPAPAVLYKSRPSSAHFAPARGSHSQRLFRQIDDITLNTSTSG
ncbi:hypothetical protein SPRG_21693, partial [Saprolegnia parasitica CBS 223.65]